MSARAEAKAPRPNGAAEAPRAKPLTLAEARRETLRNQLRARARGLLRLGRQPIVRLRAEDFAGLKAKGWTKAGIERALDQLAAGGEIEIVSVGLHVAVRVLGVQP